jgi:2-amino-4-hydroxy-6-hydroxymethyldihydropteridine diphosphokinase
VTATCYLSLGANIGDCKANLDAAVAAIGRLPDTRVVARSSYYRSAPDGPVQDQPAFINIAVVVIAPDRDTLATACRRIEAALGRDRTREISWGPRPIDIDVLGEPLDERPFVLVPLAEIAPTAVFGGRRVGEIAAAGSSTTEGLEKLDWPVPPA